MKFLEQNTEPELNLILNLEKKLPQTFKILKLP